MKTNQDLINLIARFPRPQAALASVLSELHRTHPECDSKELTDFAASLCDVLPNDVARIYASSPAFAKPQIKVCLGLTCLLYGSEEVVGCLSRMGTKTTTTSCLGHCHAAPVLQDLDGSILQASISEDWMDLQRGTFIV